MDDALIAEETMTGNFFVIMASSVASPAEGMTHSLFNLLMSSVQLIALLMVMAGSLFIVGGITSNAFGSLGKGTALLLLGLYIAGRSNLTFWSAP